MFVDLHPYSPYAFMIIDYVRGVDASVRPRFSSPLLLCVVYRLVFRFGHDMILFSVGMILFHLNHFFISRL